MRPPLLNGPVRIAAVGDIHGDETLDIFAERARTLPPVDLFLLAGDITDKNDLGAFGRVVESLEAAYRGPMVGVFGNNEYPRDHMKYRRAFPRITFLQDEAHELEIGGRRLRIVGTTGSLDKPTRWQTKNLPGIEKEYADRVARVADLLRVRDGVRILLTHYAPTFVTMQGEKQWYWEQLGSKKFEGVILDTRPDLVIHGHVHKGKPYAELRRSQATLHDFSGGAAVPVYNVAFAERKEITQIEL